MTAYELDTNAAIVVRRAVAEGGSAAKIIACAINNVYEQTARGMLEKTDKKARELGLSIDEQIEQCAIMLRMMALEAINNRKKKK